MDLEFVEDYDIEVNGRTYKLGDEIAWNDNEEGDISKIDTLDNASIIAAEKPAPLDFRQALITASLYEAPHSIQTSSEREEYDLQGAAGSDAN